MVDGTERLRFVLREVKDAAGMARARKMAKEITDSSDEGNKDLEVSSALVHMQLLKQLPEPFICCINVV